VKKIVTVLNEAEVPTEDVVGESSQLVHMASSPRACNCGAVSAVVWVLTGSIYVLISWLV
jgi:hypothetical protein